MSEMKKTINPMDDDSALSNEASAWFLLLRNDEVSAGDFARWREWVNASPAHTKAFDRVSEFWKKSDGLKDLPWPSDDDLENDEYDGSDDLPVPHAQTIRSWRNRLRAFAQIAAMLLVVAAATMVAAPRFQTLQPATPGFYETSIAEHETIQLKDGSKIVLGAMSKVAVNYTSGQRNITLVSGEAFFDVAKDPIRPFVVDAGPRSVRAIGTAFNINFREQSLAVSVVEGTVSIAVQQTEKPVNVAPAAQETGPDALLLDDGQELIVSRADDGEEIRAFNTEIVTSWRTGKLTYIGEPLENVIADLNRYSSRKIVVAEDAINIMRFTGTVFNNDIDHWLDGLDKAFPVRIIFVDDRDLVLITST